ncbi:OCIA domain-containing protein 1, partial [Stegodyphus mimosarum]
METHSTVYHGTSSAEAVTPKPQPTVYGNIALTKEELEIFHQCGRESFYSRCVPFSLAGMAATFIAVQRGILAPHPKYGAILKMAGAAFIGWLVGKFSYRRKCEDKFLRLENSKIADAIRKRRGYTSEMFQSGFGSSDDTVFKDDSFSFPSSDNYHSSAGSLNLDVDKNVQYSGLDDLGRPSTDRENLSFSDENEQQNTSITYDELRKRNREEFERRSRQSQAPRTDQSSPPVPRPWANPDMGQRRYNTGSEGTRNIYGDAWDNPKFS